MPAVKFGPAPKNHKKPIKVFKFGGNGDPRMSIMANSKLEAIKLYRESTGITKRVQVCD